MTNSEMFGYLMGNDSRSREEIIAADEAEVRRLGTTVREIAEAMQELTDFAASKLGNPVPVGDHREVTVDDNRGILACPWPHPERILKRNTTVKDLARGKTLVWSNLSIHLIGQHGFFQGRGSPYRLEPAELVEMIF
jgi:hypothetical protein